MHAWLLTAAMLAAPPSGHQGVIAGQVVHSETQEPLPGALVILQCACLQGSRETQTNEDGMYAFRGLPAGTYTVQVLVGQADVSKVITMSPSETTGER
jgi:hypothetical protein